MRYSDLASFVTERLEELGFNDIVLDPGPADDDRLQKLTPNQMVFLTLGGGSGFTTELLYDRPLISVRVIGKQNNFTSAEGLACVIDTILCQVDSNAEIGDARVLYITRTGAGPTLVEKDTSDRYHYTCSYITETRSGL